MNKISSIDNFWVTKNLILESNSKIIGLKSELNRKEVKPYFANNDFYYVHKKKLFNEQDFIIFEGDFDHLIPINNNYFNTEKNHDELSIHAIHKDGVKLWEIMDDSCSINPIEQLLFRKGYTTNSIFKRDIETGKTLWEFSVSELGKYTDWEGEHEGKIDGNIFECQGVLVMRITENQLIGLDNRTGKLLWKRQYPPTGFFYGKHLDECYVMHEQFCVLNPHTGKEEPRFPFFRVFESQNADNYCVQIFSDKYMYTIGRWDLIIMQWDKQTGEIVWKHELHPKKRKGRSGITLKGDVLEPVQFANGKLYVLDSAKTLHIFDRE